jgi:PAS domain S-box-containing protein
MMKRQHPPLTDAAILRQKAEELLKLRTDVACNVSTKENDLLKLIHELEVHQIELEMQKEELVIAKKKAELAEEKYTELYDFAPVGYFTLSHNGEILHTNLRAAQMLGKERSRLINGHFVTFVNKDAQNVFITFLKEVFLGGSLTNCEVLLSKDANSLHVLLTGIISENREQCLVTATDITERKLLEYTLRENEERLRLALRATNDVVWDWDIVNDSQRWNEAGTKVFGWTEIVERPVSAAWWVERVHPDDRQRVEKGFYEVLTNNTIDKWNDEYRFSKADGTYTDVLDRGYILRDNQGKAIRMIGAMLDISNRKQAEWALLLEKENFRISLDNSPLGVRIVSAEGNTIYANQSLLDIYGYKSLKELQTTPLKERYTKESYAEAQKRKLKREGGDLLESTYEISIVRKNGETAHLKVHRKKVLWDGIWQFQIVYEDITNSMIREKELEESHEQLEQLNFYLQKIKEEERRHIARELHDELGQALTSIKIDLGNLKMCTGDNKILKSKIEKTTELVSDSIGFVKRLTSELRPHILDDLGLISAIKWYTSEYEQRTGIKIRLNIDEKTTYEKKSELIIFRILQESLTNIARHSQAKNIIISISERNKDKLIKIKDNGIGFSTTATKHGKSFGLLNMKERAKEIGGTLAIESEPGYGTTIRLLLPGEK